MKRYLLFLMSCVLCFGLGWAQTDDFDPDTPDEPGQRARVVLSVSPQGAGTVSGAGQYNVGQSVYVSTSRNGSQWKFLRWRNAKTNAVVSTSTGFYLTTTLGTTHLVAEYEELPLTTLTLQCEPSEVGASLSGGGTYVEGASVYVRAYSVSNWTFTKWTNKRTGETVSNYYSFSFTKTAEADTLIAHYAYNPSTPGEPQQAIVYRTLSVQSNDTEMGYTSITSQQVKVGDQVSVSAYNRENYAFVGWERDGAVVSTNPTYTLTMPNRNVSLTAIFEFAPATPGDPDMAEEQPQDNPDNPDDPDDPDDPDNPDNPDEPVEPVEPSTLPGDVNGDYRVNILDLTLINGYILGIRPEKFIFANADLNQDGRISVVDATLLIALILLQH